MDAGWKRRGSRTLFESPWFKLRQDEVTLPNSEDVTYSWIEHPGYAMIVPLLGDGRVVMERVYRYAVGKTLLECPSGGLEGEPPAVAATRELEEETGYLADAVEPLGTYYGSSGISNERFHLFLAQDVAPGGQQQLEATEQIEVELIPLDELIALTHRGEVTDGPSALGILLAAARLSR